MMNQIKKSAFILLLLAAILLTICASADGLDNMIRTGSMELKYATQFSVDYYDGGYKLIRIADGSRFLVIPESGCVPASLASDIQLIRQPLAKAYLAATSSMCLFDALDRLDVIGFSGTREDGWSIPNAQEAMREGRILFAGKYSEPDYELLTISGCPLAIESLMIGHASDVREKLLELGINVIVDHSSLEPHPLGRTEWIKLYAALTNEEERAIALFDKQTSILESIDTAPTGATVAFFYVGSTGRVVARKSNDYISRMIALAGGEYVFRDLGDPGKATSTETLTMEAFYNAARDADCIIYNNTIGGEVYSLDDLLRKNELFAEFKAVRTGNVWCTDENMYQQTTDLGVMIGSFHSVISGEADGMNQVPYLYRLK